MRSREFDIDLNGKSVLLIGPRFFGYETRIINQLKARGANPHFIDDRPSNDTLTKILVRVSPKLIKSRLRSYHTAQIAKYKKIDFDFLLFIEPESCSKKIISQYKTSFPSSRFILYLWDSLRNKAGHLVDCLEYFDQSFSFDDIDCNVYGLRFRPLFFLQQSPSDLTRPDPVYAISFIGTVHSDRHKLLASIFLQAKRLNLSCFYYPFLPSKLMYFVYKITKPEWRKVRMKDINFKPLAYQEVLQVMNSSSAVIDIEHPGQRGLTMRTLEIIGADKKILTTNAQIRNYPFYSSDRVKIIDRSSPEIESAFFESIPKPLPEELLRTYSVDGWLDEILK
jgi:hypothetical protein